MRILGIDPGTATTGWAIIDSQNNKTKAIAYGHIQTHKDTPSTKRLKEIANDITELVKKYHPEESAVEDLFFFKNVKTVMTVSQARGAILLTLEQQNVKIAEYTPLQVKQAITGYGRADKKQIQETIKTIFNLKEIPKPDDTADALAVAFCHASSRIFKNL